jgi:surfeit locus 1 family protein
MKTPDWIAFAIVVLVASVCVRLGFWQVSRWHEKQALNAAMQAAARAPALEVGSEPPPLAAARQRALEMTGSFDERCQILLSGRAHDGAPGVEVVTPLVLAGGRAAILVNRGWIYAADAVNGRPQRFPEPGVRTVRGFVEELRHGAGGPPQRALERDSVTLWSARWLDADSLATRLPYAVADYVVRQSPAPGVAGMPRRSLPRPYNELTHLSYAVQWFLFAGILLGGSAALAWSRRRDPASGSEDPR